MSKVLKRVVSECRFVANTLVEAMAHPRSTSEIDKRTGRVISRNGHLKVAAKPDRHR